MPICKCSKCSLLIYLDRRDKPQAGQIQPSRIFKQHIAEDRLREMAAEEAQSAVENKILLETLKDGPSRPASDLPVRPNDLPARAPQARPEEEVRPDPVVVRERIALVARLNSGRDSRARPLPDSPTLVFKAPPASPSDPPSELDASKGDNFAFSQYKAWLEDSIWSHGDLPPVGHVDADHRYIAEIRMIRSELERLAMLEALAWNRLVHENLYRVNLDPSRLEPQVVDGSLMLRKPPSIEPFILAALLMATILHSLASVSFPQATYLLSTLRAILFGALTFSCVGSAAAPPQLSVEQQSLLNLIPLDIRSVIKLLHLEPDVLAYASCPRCHTTYPPDKNNPLDPYPHHCTAQETDKPMCGALLVRKRLIAPKHKNGAWQHAFTALQSYPYHPLKSWLAEFLGRPGMLDLLRKSWDRPHSSTYHDIMDAPAIREFYGPDGITFFSVQPNGSLHLVFSLFVDWFNPYGNKKAGKSHSIGVIYLACLNIPPHLRYRPENIFLAGIIPGPKEPQLHELNHFLRPLIDELLEFWDPGLYIAQTVGGPASCLVRAAVIPLVCDLPALRKTAGFASHSSKHFCSFCPLLFPNISNLDRSTWPQARTWQEHFDIARQWRDATTESDRRHIFEEHGIRWSELLRLPYWDPTRYAVLDVMHNLFLGELHHHVRQVWNLDSVGQGSGSGAEPRHVVAHSPKEQQTQLDRILSALSAKNEDALAVVRKDYLSAVARFNHAVGLTSADPTKRELARALLRWSAERQHDLSTFRLPPVLPESVKRFHLPLDEPPREACRYAVFTRNVLEAVRQDIQATVLPSWIEKVPSNFGGPGHGKLKADHWRTVCTVNMVITLVRLWGTATSSIEEVEVLKNFLHLVVAVTSASRRSMGEAQAAMYEYHMEEYLLGLRRLYNHTLVPNHHLSLHLRRFLELFGPVHGWWAFAFERYNGLLQRMNTNFKPAEMPTTFIRYFYMGSALRWLMRVTPWPRTPQYDHMVKSFETAFNDRVRGTRVTDFLSFGEPPLHPDFDYDHRQEALLPAEDYNTLLSVINASSAIKFQAYDIPVFDGRPLLHPRGQFVPNVHHNGVRFASAQSGERDSRVVYCHGGELKAGQISSIFYHQRTGPCSLMVEPFLVVSPYSELTPAHAAHDPYRPFPELNTRLYYNTFETRKDIVSFGSGVAHLATLTYTPPEIGQDCIVALSLDRIQVGTAPYKLTIMNVEKK